MYKVQKIKNNFGEDTMQIEKVKKLIEEAGHSTKLEICTMPCFRAHLKEILPEGKVLILLEESVPLELFKAVQEQVNCYRQYVLFLEEKENATALFSLPDDIRMVIALGKRAVKIGRIFATLRRCYSVVIAIDFDSSEFFCTKIESNSFLVDSGFNSNESSEYPVQPLTLILVDTALLQDKREGLLKLANCTLTAIDIELDALFRGEKNIKNYYLPKIDSENILELYFATILEGLTITQFSNFAYLNTQKLLDNDDLDKKFAFCCYFIERYQLFFQKNLRKYYVPNYMLRFQYALQYFGKSITLENIEVFTAEKSKKIYDIFEQSRFMFIPYIKLLEVYSEKLQFLYNKLSARKVQITQTDKEYFAKLYNISAESTNLYLPPLLEREFGLLEIQYSQEVKK